MLRGQRMILNLLALASFLAAFFFISTNFFKPVSFRFFTQPLIAQPLGYPMLIAGGLMSLSILFKLLEMLNTMRHSHLKTQHERENAEVIAESSVEKIKSLEAKITTLEKALESALAGTKTG